VVFLGVESSQKIGNHSKQVGNCRLSML